MIIAIDPGKVTGFAIWDGDELSLADQVDLHEFLTWFDDEVRQYAQLIVPRFDAVVCERFTVNARTVSKSADAHWAMKGIGVVEYLCTRFGIPFVLQSPSEAKAFGTDDKLRACDWYKGTKGGHRNDACRHLLTYLVRSTRGSASTEAIDALMSALVE